MLDQAMDACAARRRLGRRVRCPVVSAAAWRSRRVLLSQPTCCSSTSPRTTWTPRASRGSRTTSRTTRARSSRSPTIATSSTTSPARSSSSIAATASPTRATTPPWLVAKQKRLEMEEKTESSRHGRSQGRARVGAPEPQGPPHQVPGSPEPLRGPGLRGAQREDRGRPDPHPGRRPPGSVSSSRPTDLRKGFGDRLLIEDLSFNLPPAGIVGVIGPTAPARRRCSRCSPARSSRTRAAEDSARP